VGAAFAQYEMRVVLRAILERAELAAPDRRSERVKLRNITLAPGKGGRVVLMSPLVGAPSRTLKAAREPDRLVAHG
jgi:hypothetical protein